MNPSDDPREELVPGTFSATEDIAELKAQVQEMRCRNFCPHYTARAAAIITSKSAQRSRINTAMSKRKSRIFLNRIIAIMDIGEFMLR